MKTVISLGLAFLLVAAVARSLWSDDDTDRITATAKHHSTETLSEASESWNDDRLVGALSLVSAMTFNDNCPIPSCWLSEPFVKANSIRDNSIIYKLNSRFLI